MTRSRQSSAARLIPLICGSRVLIPPKEQGLRDKNKGRPKAAFEVKPIY